MALLSPKLTSKRLPISLRFEYRLILDIKGYNANC